MFSGNWLTRSLGAVGLFVALSSSALLAGCGNSDDGRPATWSYIYPAIIEPSCATASCHSSFSSRAGVNLGDQDNAWYQLNCRHFVVPNDTGVPQQSELINLLSASGAKRMPPDFPLPAADIQTIQAWITAGAANDVEPGETVQATCPTK